MVTDEKDFELLGDPSKMTGYSRPPENKLAAVTRVLGVCTAVAMIMMFVLGMAVGWSSPYLAKFTSGDAPFLATEDEISWMASIYQLGGFPGGILGAVLVQFLGSRTAMFINSCGLLIAWILVGLANSVGWIYAARFIFGMCLEVASISVPLYLGDISNSRIRGALVSFAMNGLVIGIVVGNAMGAYLSLKLFAWIALIPSLCVVLIFFWLPHSPYYLMSKARVTEAGKTVRRYNPKADVDQELESIKQYLSISNSMTFVDRLRELNIPRNRRAIIISLVLTAFSACTGINAMTNYLQLIMTRGKVTVIAPSTVPIIANSIGIIAGWLIMYFVEKFGRRTMWVVSSSGLCCATIMLGTNFYLIDRGFDPTGFQWLSLTSVFLIKIFYNIGLSCIPCILLSELFASNIRTLVGCIIIISPAAFGFLSIYGYQYVVANLEEAYAWWSHAIIMAASAIFGLVLVPEMTGKSLLQIQTELMKN